MGQKLGVKRRALIPVEVALLSRQRFDNFMSRIYRMTRTWYYINNDSV